MKILLVHNHYRSDAPSGENLVFELERDMLVRRGHDVATFERRSDTLGAGVAGRLRGAFATPWNAAAAADFRRTLAAFRPDVVHAHNTFPFISPAIFHAASRSARQPAPGRVLTLHNYRLFCAAGVPLRDGRTCTECLDRRSALPGLLHGCYRGSRLATLPVSLGVALHRGLGTWTTRVEAFIALTAFQRDLVIAAGLPPARVHVKPHFYPGTPPAVDWSEREPRVVFAGRLGEEKGIADLVEAWIAWGPDAPELRIAGEGPLRPALEARARAAGATNITFVGALPREEAEREIATCRLLVLPSTCFEGFPMVIREALALGTPCAVSALGPLPALIGAGEDGLPGAAGVVFPPGDPAGLLQTVRALWSDPRRLASAAGTARALYEGHYTEDANYDRLIDIYEQARRVRAVPPETRALAPTGTPA